MDVVMTGATGGIGRALARCLAAHGARLFLSGRNTESLNALRNELSALTPTQIHVHACDLSQSNLLPGLKDAIESVMGNGVDVLINNAGIGYHGRIDRIDAAELLETFQVNVFAPILLTSALLPLLRRSGRGHVVNVSSVLGTSSMRYTSTYTASKHALNGFSKTLRLEAAPDIRVTIVEPGAVETNFLRRTHEPSAVEAFGARRLQRMPPEVVAEWVWLAISADPAICPEVLRVCPAGQAL